MKDEKVGIVLCTCGNKLKEKIDFEALKAFASNLKDTLVLEVKDFCKNPKEKIKPFLGKIDRLIFAGCSERSSLSFNEDFIQKLLKEINIDPAYFETVNLREQIFNIHTQKDQILNKAKDQLLMAYEKVKSNKPSLKLNKLKKEVLIVGGGVAGQRCAQALADLGIKSTIVEEKTYLGGTATKISLLWQSESYPSSCTSLCIMPVVGRETLLKDEIDIFLNSQIVDVVKENGNFKVKIKRKPTYVDPEKCIGCGKCTSVCPVELPNPFDLGKTKRKAIDKDFTLAIPDVHNILREYCEKDCKACQEVCPTNAINLDAKEKVIEKEFGAVVIATGFKESGNIVKEILGYKYDNVVTLLELERYLANNFFKKVPQKLAFVLAVDLKRPYCSRLGCLETVKLAAILKARFPNMKIDIFYKELKTTGRAFTRFRRSLEKASNVNLIQSFVKKIEKENDTLKIITSDGKTYEADFAVLAEDLVPSDIRLTKILDIYTDNYGFPLEFQPRVINPLETFLERVYVIGGAKGFKDIQESIESAYAAAVRIFEDLKGKDKKYYAYINQDKCSRCENCMTACPHGVISVKHKEDGKQIVEISKEHCRGCGLCYGACPSKAISFVNMEEEQILNMAKVAFKHLPKDKPRILAFLCYWCAYGAADLMGYYGEILPENFRSIRIRCSAILSLDVIWQILKEDLADGIIVAGCPKLNCHHAWGNYMQVNRIKMLNDTLELMGIKNKKVVWEYIGVGAYKKLANSIRKMNKELSQKLKRE